MEPPSDLAQLSWTVLRSVSACVPAADSRATAELLYHANWLPLTPGWLTGLPDETAVLALVSGDVETARSLSTGWVRQVDQHWVYWHSAASAHARVTRFKVYLSVLPDALPAGFGRALTVFGARQVPSFKLSRRPRGLLRPDRLVAYCDTVTAARGLADELAVMVGELPAQGVPFTSAPGGQAAVSWARDPDPPASTYGGSWRRWVTRKLAGYLHASDAATPGGRAEFALARLADDGVDVPAWAPGPRMWSTS